VIKWAVNRGHGVTDRRSSGNENYKTG